ncbi:hypothetical protein [Fulvimonas soli]|nr:hypothetical protein [Fulvimonas soli]TNY26706.1 hypothetical protein BV497_07255 [Fulvimonas soli]
MKTRCVFATRDLATARAAMAAAHRAGVDDADIAFLAREDIEQAQIPDHRLLGRNDFYPAARRGVVWGGVSGLALGLAAEWLAPAFQFSTALVIAAIGAIAGAWIGALVGSEVPDPVDRKFRSEIDRGHILVVIDAPGDRLAQIEPAVVHAGARPLPFHARTIFS